MTDSGYLNATVEAAFKRLAGGRMADEIGLYALEERCASAWAPGMSVMALVHAVLGEYGAPVPECA